MLKICKFDPLGIEHSHFFRIADFQIWVAVCLISVLSPLIHVQHKLWHQTSETHFQNKSPPNDFLLEETRQMPGQRDARRRKFQPHTTTGGRGPNVERQNCFLPAKMLINTILYIKEGTNDFKYLRTLKIFQRDTLEPTISKLCETAVKSGLLSNLAL